MKLLLHSFLGLALIFNLSAQADKAKTESKKETTEHKDMKIVSYLIGADIGSNMKNAELGIEVERFIEGFKASVAGKKIEFSDEDKQRILGAFSADRQAISRKQSQMKAFGLDSIEAWDKLAAKNIITMEDLAEQAVDDLLDVDEINEERAAALIMTARAPWFAEESE